jgi:hypothetical protein
MESSLRARQLSGLSRWEAVYELVKFLAVLLLFAQVSFADSGTYLNIIKSHSPTLLLVAGEGVSKDSSNLVSSWKDLASGIDFAQATADKQPLLAVDANGVPVIRFDGTDDGLASTSTLANIFAADAKTFFAVIKSSSTAAARRVISQVSNTKFFLAQNATGGFIIYNDDGAADTLTLTGFTANQTTIVTGWHDGTNIYGSLNGATATSKASSNTSSLTGALAVGLQATQYWLGDIYAIVTYNTVLDEADRTEVYNALVAYIASKPKGEWQVSEGGRPWFR